MYRLKENYPSTPDNSFTVKWIDDYPLADAKFNGNCLRLDNVFLLHKNIVHLYITYKLDIWSGNLNTDFLISNYVCGAVKLTKNSDPDKYGYGGYGTGFNTRSHFL